MPIRIHRGPGGSNSPFVSFVGVSSDSGSASSNFNFVENIKAEISGDPDKVDIVNRMATDYSPHTVYEIQEVHYTDWLDDDGNPFTSAVGVASYINSFAYDYSSGFDILEPRMVGANMECTQ